MRAFFFASLCCAGYFTVSVVKASVSPPPLLGIDLPITVVFAITLIFLLINSQNTLLTFGSAVFACNSKGGVNLTSLKRTVALYSLLIPQVIWPMFLVANAPRGSDQQLTWARVHVALFASCFLSMALITFWFSRSLRATIASTLALTSRKASHKQTDMLAELDKHLKRHANVTCPMMLVVSAMFFFAFIDDAHFSYMSYFIPIAGLMGGLSYLLQLARVGTMMRFEADHPDRDSVHYK